jgi:TolA-binding protein
MKYGIIAGIVLIAAGFGIVVYWDGILQPEDEAKKLLREGNLLFERSDKASINGAISHYSSVIARYPHTDSVKSAYYNMARSYEKLKLYRLAYLKYIYVLKTDKKMAEPRKNELKSRIARLRVTQEQTEEGIHQLFDLLSTSDDKDFRGRVYTELGHAYLKNGELKKSRKMFDLALKENGPNEEAVLGKARVLKKLGYASDAYDLYDYFIKYFGGFSNYTWDVKKSYELQLYHSGHSAYLKASYWSAQSYLARFIRTFPGSSRMDNVLYWAGESMFHLKKYDAALTYYQKALTNRLSGRDEDARIRRGYTYFIMKKYDMAAREFQIYLDTWPEGRHAESATKWKEMSTRELMYRINNKTRDDSIKTDESVDEISSESDSPEQHGIKGIMKEEKQENEVSEDKYENVAEM